MAAGQQAQPANRRAAKRCCAPRPPPPPPPPHPEAAPHARPPAALLEDLPQAVEARGHRGVAHPVHPPGSLQAGLRHRLRLRRPGQQQHGQRLQVLQGDQPGGVRRLGARRGGRLRLQDLQRPAAQLVHLLVPAGRGVGRGSGWGWGWAGLGATREARHGASQGWRCGLAGAGKRSSGAPLKAGPATAPAKGRPTSTARGRPAPPAGQPAPGAPPARPHLPRSSVISASDCSAAATSGCSSPQAPSLMPRQRWASGSAAAALPAVRSSPTRWDSAVAVSGWLCPWDASRALSARRRCCSACRGRSRGVCVFVCVGGGRLWGRPQQGACSGRWEGWAGWWGWCGPAGACSSCAPPSSRPGGEVGGRRVGVGVWGG
jgi:hypothetical protein